MKEIILIEVSGDDKPGVTAAITEILADYHVFILDIGQAVIHNNLALGILVEVPKEFESAPILKDILFRAHGLGFSIQFTPIDLESYQKWVKNQGKPRYIVTLLARRITGAQLARVSAIVAKQGLNIDSISRLSGRIPLNATGAQIKACVEFSLRGTAIQSKTMREEFLSVANELGVDIMFQEDNVYRRVRRLVVFDMDSTLIEAEVIDELAKMAGVGEEVSAITEQAMRGELDFKESFQRRLALLKGLEESTLSAIASQLPLTEGVGRLFSTLKKLGYKTAILSGGFQYFCQHLQEILGIDYIYANELEIVDGKITGKVTGQVVDGQRKRELLIEIAKKEQISLEQVIAVGDGANDLPMLSAAGLGIAFRAKPLVEQSVEQSLTTIGLDGILYLMGVRDRETSHRF
ncbi:MAG: phosphoserine phosphatase SerB [SAR324 cluster bacterium]|nr:phosphoserine phosphatase SerB [SAR324 cluster bacterium]